MNINPIKLIYKFNEQADLLKQGYSDERESAFPIEEALEGFDTTFISTALEPDSPVKTPKELSRLIIKLAKQGADSAISDVDRLDKHLDSIVFAFGSIFKLGLTPQQAMRALEVVMLSNMKKLTVGTDKEGKQCKPDNFIGPEEELQKILNERR